MISKLTIRLAAFAAILVLAAIPLLAQSKIVERWVLTGVSMPVIKKMLVIAVLENYLIWQQFETKWKSSSPNLALKASAVTWFSFRETN